MTVVSIECKAGACIGVQTVRPGEASESVRTLCARIARGDAEAFSRFYQQRFGSMFDEARRLTGLDESFCLDVVQDSMMKVMRAIPPLETEAQLCAWLRAVVKSCAYDRLRTEARRRRREQAARSQDQAGGTDPESQPDLDDRLLWLRNELSQLDRDLYRLIDLRHRLGWSLARIGRLVGLAPGAVDGRIRRAIGALRSRARETFDD